MSIPALTSGPEVHLRLALAHLAALEGDPAVSALAPPVRAAADRLREAGQRRQAAWETSTAKLALRERADFEVDRLLRELHADAQRASGGDAHAGPCADLFPGGLVPVLTASAAALPPLLRELEARLEGAGDLGRRAAPVREARERLEATLRDHVAAVRADAEAAAELELAKTDLRRQVRASFAALVCLLGDRARAESYFLSRAGESTTSG